MTKVSIDVLVVDDDRILREVVSRILQEAGYQVGEAVDGLEAWQLLQRTHCLVLLTDCWMPHMSGPQLFDHVRTRWPEIQVVFMSAGEQDLAEIILMRGAHAWLEKPFGDTALLEAIKTAIHGVSTDHQENDGCCSGPESSYDHNSVQSCQKP